MSERLFWSTFSPQVFNLSFSILNTFSLKHSVCVAPRSLDYFLICWDSCQLQPRCLTTCTIEVREREIPLAYTGVNNVEAGREACHGGRSGPPRLWPAVPLSCPSPQRTKPTQGGKGTWRGEGGGRFVEYSCHSAPHNLGVWREGRRETDRQRQRETEWDLCSAWKLSCFLFLLLTLCYYVTLLVNSEWDTSLERLRRVRKKRDIWNRHFEQH